MGPVVWLVLILSGLGRPFGGASSCPTDGRAGEVHAAQTPLGTFGPCQSYGRDATTTARGADAKASALGSEDPWRRTRDGWELPRRWTYHRKSRPPALHPIVVGLLEMFLALAALIAFSEAGSRTSRANAKSAGRPNRRRG